MNNPCKSIIILNYFVAVLILLSIAHAQVCMTYEETACEDIVTWPVSAETQEQFDSAVFHTTRDVGESAVLDTINSECFYSFRTYTCGTYLPPCVGNISLALMCFCCLKMGACARSYSVETASTSRLISNFEPRGVVSTFSSKGEGWSSFKATSWW